MTVFGDTSAFCALLDRKDPMNRRPATYFEDLLSNDEPIVTHNYVLSETAALLHRRLGLAASRSFFVDIAPLVEVVWVDEEQDAAAVAGLLSLTTHGSVARGHHELRGHAKGDHPSRLHVRPQLLVGGVRHGAVRLRISVAGGLSGG